MSKTFFKKSIIGGIVSLFFVGIVSAQTSQVTFPIPELGGCKDVKACKAYCDIKSNMLACVNYAEGKDMISKEEATIAKRVLPKIQAKETPGNCDSRESCDSYCRENSDHIDECISFAEDLDVLSKDELAQAKKVAKALKEGAELPGGCKGKDSCENYCADTNHIDECLSFAEKSGIIPEAELVEAKKVSKFLKDGTTPGKCKTKEECMNYCASDNHFEECLNFAEKAGMAPKEELEMARKVGGKGPGGCKSGAECQSYCEDPAHAKECSQFAIDKGLVSEEEKKLIEEAPKQLAEGLKQVPDEFRPAVESCLNETFNGKLSEVLVGSIGITKVQGGKIGDCFQNAMSDKINEQIKQSTANFGEGKYKSPLGEGGKAPNLEDIRKQIPDNVPPEARAQIEKQIEEKMKQGGAVNPQDMMQGKIPEEYKKYIPKDVPEGTMPKADQAKPDMKDIPDEYKQMGPPAGIVPQGIPSGQPTGVMAPPSGVGAPTGVQGGPPCNFEEECKAMFGGGR